MNNSTNATRQWRNVRSDNGQLIHAFIHSCWDQASTAFVFPSFFYVGKVYVAASEAFRSFYSEVTCQRVSRADSTWNTTHPHVEWISCLRELVRRTPEYKTAPCRIDVMPTRTPQRSRKLSLVSLLRPDLANARSSHQKRFRTTVVCAFFASPLEAALPALF